jgi:hypothetical protein
MAKMILGGVAAVLIALLAGLVWGNSGKSTIESALQRSELRNELLESKGAVLAARIDIYNTNFGEASRHLEEGRGAVTRAVQRLQELDRDDEATRLQAAVGPIEEAQRLAGKLDLGANARAAEAAQAIDAMLEVVGRP